jgi:hypothetical protein
VQKYFVSFVLGIRNLESGIAPRIGRRPGQAQIRATLRQSPARTVLPHMHRRVRTADCVEYLMRAARNFPEQVFFSSLLNLSHLFELLAGQLRFALGSVNFRQPVMRVGL